MNHENAIRLWRLKEGLARDEQIAREAAQTPGPAWESYVCEDYPGQYSTGVGSDRPHCDEFVRVDYEAVSDHIAEFDPRRVLCQVEAIRKALEDLKLLADPDEYGIPSVAELASSAIAALASIYTDPTEGERMTDDERNLAHLCQRIRTVLAIPISVGGETMRWDLRINATIVLEAALYREAKAYLDGLAAGAGWVLERPPIDTEGGTL